MLSPFISCLTEQLEKRGFGEKRQAELVDRFQGLRENFVKQGAADADTLAMNRVLDEVIQATADKQKIAYDTLLKRAQLGDHFESFDYNKSIVTDGKTTTSAAAAVALLSPDPRSKSGLNVDTLTGTYKDQAWAVMNDVLDGIGKGMFGTQRGKASMDNIVREIHGQATGDVFAAQMAKSWIKGTDNIVNMWNYSGGVLRKLDGWALPQNQSLAAVIKQGGEKGATWIADHMDWLNWDKMQWPNGAPIKPEDRQRVLEAVWQTLSSDGGNKIKPGSFEGQGAAIGNLVDQHRFMIFKDGDAWLAQHEKYGDGNLFDVMANYVDHMTQKMALMRVFSNNPEAMAKTVRELVLSRAEGADLPATKAGLSRFDMLFEQAMRKNAMNPESVMANAIVGTSNVLNSAFLAGVTLAAMPGDFATTMMMRAADHMPILDGLIGPYIRGLVSPMETAKLSAEAGFIMDGLVHTIHAKTRFTALGEFGPAWTKRLSDLTMRSSGMNVHTEVLRWVNQQHWMGMLDRARGVGFDDVPWKAVAERYGITADMWEKVKTIAPYEPRDGVSFFRPSDILQSGNAGAQDMYERFQSMMLQESRNMVLDTNAEANVILKGNLRPDSVPGALLHSFAMYKNFPIGLALTYGRVAMAMPERSGRLAFIAGMGASLILAGAVGMQMREVSKGRDTLPMDTASFWGKALLASGAMSVWGDFLFNGINKPSGPADVTGGPIPGFVGDTMQLALGDVFDWADKVGTLKADKQDKKAPWAAKATEYASRYMPGTSLWYARAALQREIFDPLRRLADPRGATKMDHKERQRVKDFGNDSWWPPGQALPDRPPQITGSSQ